MILKSIASFYQKSSMCCLFGTKLVYRSHGIEYNKKEIKYAINNNSMGMLILIYLINKNIDWEDVWLKENINLIFIQIMSL